MKQLVVIMMGYSATGKSYTASYLGRVLPTTTVIHSAVTRNRLDLAPVSLEHTDNYFDITNRAREPMDRAVYGAMLRQAVNLMRDGSHVILDAGHWFLWMRKAIYTTLYPFDPEILVLRTVCPGEVVLHRLSERRSKFGTDDIHESPSISVYHSTVNASEPFSAYDTLPDNTLPVEIVFDTNSGDITINEERSDYSYYRTVVDTLGTIKS